MLKIRQRIAFSDNEFILGVLIVFAVAFIVAESRWSRLHNENAISSDETLSLYLDQRTGLEELSEKLFVKDAIRSEEEILWAGRLLGWRNFRPGHYQIDRSYSYEGFLSKLARGIEDPIQLTIVPGMTLERIVDRISSTLKFDSSAIQKTLGDSAYLAGHDINQQTLIGRFIPDTYSVYWTSPPETVLDRIFNTFSKNVTQQYAGRLKELGMTVDEIVTLASIVEWEANFEEEKATISGLYWNRLDRGMRLQADPTVNYAVQERRRLLYEDYKIDHPYNTYLYRGLPPGPITNPSLSSIRAALFPEDHDYLYMVASPDGKHVFAETFREHKENSAKWREWLQEQYRLKRLKEQDQEN